MDSDQAIVVRRAAAKMVAMVLTNGTAACALRAADGEAGLSDGGVDGAAASAGAATDDNMNDMFRLDRLQLFASWLSQPDPEIRACACLCISNLARTGTFAARPFARRPLTERPR